MLLASGGDARISVPGGANTNLYGASPFPRETLGYAASTANDISLSAFEHLQRLITGWPAGALLSARAYAVHLDLLRSRIRHAYGLDRKIDIVFAPSGTDLEYVALQLARTGAGKPITNILLGAEEVGSGCILAGAGRHFANETAIMPQVAKGAEVGGLGDTAIVDVPVRNLRGIACDPREIGESIEQQIRIAHASGRHPLVHVVHGSKTGLVLPDLATTDRILARHGNRVSIAVDACQARIEGPAIKAYLDRGAMVLMTGSKFMGGPPFSGFALIPAGRSGKMSLGVGLGTIFRRAEWPRRWGVEGLPDGANPGLLLRLEAAVFELERYSDLSSEARNRVIACFRLAVSLLAERLGARLVPGNAGVCSVETATLATIDLTGLPDAPDFLVAQRWHRVLAARGIRLGQPVKCVRLPDGRWGGTLRISLSMPLIVELAKLDPVALAARFDRDMSRITAVLMAATRRKAG